MEKEDSEKATIILKDFQKLETFILADDLDDFSNLTIEMSTLCFEYDEMWDETMERMSESEFYSLVNKHYFQLAKLFLAVSTSNLPYEKLIYRSFKILAGILEF